MGRFELERLNQLKSKGTTPFTTVIETGTCLGYSTQDLSQYFKTVHTVEIQEPLYRNAREKFAHNPNIHCHNGDSVSVLKNLASTVKERAVFYLDAHWSGDNTVDWEASRWKGYPVETGCRGVDKAPENQNPLHEELKVIMENYTQEVIVYIDDMDKFDTDGKGMKDFGFKGEDWSHLTVNKMLDIVKGRVIDVVRFNDQMIVHLGAQ